MGVLMRINVRLNIDREFFAAAANRGRRGLGCMRAWLSARQRISPPFYLIIWRLHAEYRRFYRPISKRIQGRLQGFID